jgi:hypothetical protein
MRDDMKQKVMMVVCVLFGAALVMMCDTDAVQGISDVVQDMVDGEEASATDTPSGGGPDEGASSGTGDGGNSSGSGGTSAETQALIDALTSQVEALESRVAALESASPGSDWLTQTTELFGITCPAESVLVTEDYVDAACMDRATHLIHGPRVENSWSGHREHLYNYADGKRHGLQFDYNGYDGSFREARCYDMNAQVWCCTTSGGSVCGLTVSGDVVYLCNTQEEVDALVAEHGCP